MPSRDVVVIGGSAGALEALSTIVGALPAALPASVLVVVHSAPHGGFLLPDILQRVTKLTVAAARDGDAVRHGRVYLARPDQHLLIEDRKLVLGRGPRENGFRPAIDPLFRTAAREFGARMIGIVLSGALSDGAYGLSAVKAAGGVAIVQDPREARVATMPLNALNEVDVDYMLPAADIAEVVTRLVRTDRGKGGSPMAARTQNPEPQLASQLTDVAAMSSRFGPPSGLTCPDCGGALWEIDDGRVVRYECHVGHQYAGEGLDAGQRDAIDAALWTAVRVLEEHADLKARLARRAAERDMAVIAASFAQGAADARSQAERIRSLMVRSTAARRPHAIARGRKRRQS